jgi:hypothetical protein
MESNQSLTVFEKTKSISSLAVNSVKKSSLEHHTQTIICGSIAGFMTFGCICSNMQRANDLNRRPLRMFSTSQSSPVTDVKFEHVLFDESPNSRLSGPVDRSSVVNHAGNLSPAGTSTYLQLTSLYRMLAWIPVGSTSSSGFMPAFFSQNIYADVV